jgi:hypothetical protein
MSKACQDSMGLALLLLVSGWTQRSVRDDLTPPWGVHSRSAKALKARISTVDFSHSGASDDTIPK